MPTPHKPTRREQRRQARNQTPATGRASIFRNKSQRVQGLLTVRGSVRFEHARKRLAQLVDRDPEHVSDGDTAEFLARGEDETRRYLDGKRD